ncbi:hypothetical protein SAMN03159343_1313 [Klenkia marina]|uniref:Gram-positive cocci surface proteins LPxTG domain-containing protein n=1 Tax=Klenkia marina TaxID=1960309 RepID=A0A1G4XRS0_9ACTN|nr:hypothetical protein [Klenkia marina]SCX43882.1 hypothetical protein SAMN03159343_1313 [Klenkia marina]
MNRTVRNGLAVATMAGGIFLLGSAVASADEGTPTTTASSESVGGPAVTEVDTSTNADGYAEGHEVGNAGIAVGGAGGNGGSVVQAPVSSGVVAGSVHGDTTASSSAESTVTNTGAGGDGGSAAVSPVTSGDVTGGNAGADGGGDVTATSESVGAGGGSGAPATDAVAATSPGGTGGALTSVDASTDASATAGGHEVTNLGVAAGGQGGNGGDVLGAPVSSGTICFAWKGDNHCSSTATSTITNNSPGGNGGDASVSPVTSGNVSGGNASANGGGSTTASAESLALGEFLHWLSGGLWGMSGDGGAHTWVDSSTNASGSVHGHQVDNAGLALGGNGGKGGSVVGAPVTSYVICFAYKGDNHCSSTATSTITNNSPGGKGGDASVSPVTSGDVTGGNACASSSGTPCPSATAPTHPVQPAAPVHPAAPAPAHPVIQPAAAEHPAAAAPVQRATPAVSHSAGWTTVHAASSSPSTLAYTGADVTDALGLGLLALAGGLGLALAGRRRSAA